MVERALEIVENVGISSTDIICKHKIISEDNVTMGGGTVFYDTNFHSLSKEVRKNIIADSKESKFGEILIKKNAFIGAHSTLLKRVTIDENNIVRPCSVIRKILITMSRGR